MSPDPFPTAADTIVAVSTPPGRSGLGVVRISGPRTREIIQKCFRSSEAFQDRLARYGRLTRPSGDLIDTVVVTVFEAPRSYTGEHVAEISAHGNPMILKEIVAEVVSLGGRPASPGEFTLRAVVNGKMDLAQAEAVRDFIEAQTEGQAQVARLQMGGALARRIRPLTEDLVQAVAELEAGIDFAEDDVEVADSKKMAERIGRIATALERDAASFDFGRLVTQGLYVAITGKPNVGKSSLFNRLVRTERSIVTDLRGTTRDVLAEVVDIGGVPVRLADTAGLREAPGNRVEQIGVGRALETMAESDIALVVLDGSEDLDLEDRAVVDRAQEQPHIFVINKNDLPQRWDAGEALKQETPIRVSARTGEGIDRLEARIQDYLERQRPDTGGFFLVSERQQSVLSAAAGKLRAASAALEESVPHEMVLVSLYAGLAQLGELTGEVVTDDILDRVFSTFCVGK
jgi:tRNA modification GTPase